jgi:hypothetical protein
MRLHTETACRRGGALALRPCDLDPEQCLILLHEKGETVRWQPVFPTLMAQLLQHVDEGGSPRREQLLRSSAERVSSVRCGQIDLGARALSRPRCQDWQRGLPFSREH